MRPRPKPRFARSLLPFVSISVLVLFTVGLVVIFRVQPQHVAPASVAVLPQDTMQAQADSPLPTPAPIEIRGPDGMIITPETPTPIPTWTPRPTPTRRPGPTETPFPIRQVFRDPAGTLLYVVQATTPENVLSQSILYRLPFGSQGEKLSDPAPMLIPQLKTFSNISLSPDGRYLLFLQPAMPGGTLYVLEMQTGRLWSLAPEGEHESGLVFGWHPDSERILFWNDKDHLLLINVITLERTILKYAQGSIQGGAISPDGQTIAFVDGLQIAPNHISEAMWTTSSSGSDAKPLVVFDGTSYLFSWSPDGRYLLYMGGPGTHYGEEALVRFESRGPLWIIDPNGENPQPLSGRFTSGAGYIPVWSPDSQWIAFTGLDEGKRYGCSPEDKTERPQWPQCRFEGMGIYAENIKTGEVRRLASGIHPTWSPDGTIVAFLSYQSGASEVWTVRLDGTELLQITFDGAYKNEVVWVPKEEIQE